MRRLTPILDAILHDNGRDFTGRDCGRGGETQVGIADDEKT